MHCTSLPLRYSSDILIILSPSHFDLLSVTFIFLHISFTSLIWNIISYYYCKKVGVLEPSQPRCSAGPESELNSNVKISMQSLPIPTLLLVRKSQFFWKKKWGMIVHLSRALFSKVLSSATMHCGKTWVWSLPVVMLLQLSNCKAHQAHLHAHVQLHSMFYWWYPIIPTIGRTLSHFINNVHILNAVLQFPES